MKYLHLADLHLGKRLKEVNLLPDQAEILNQLVEICARERTDGVIIAGDVYDKSVPSQEAVLLFDDFLTRLKKMGQEIFVVAGNHDSAERLSFGSALLAESGVHLSKTYSGAVEKVTFEKHGEKQNLYLLPFLRPIQVKVAYPDEEISSYQDAVKCALTKAKLDESEVNILITHQFVTGAEESGSEEMTVGGLNNVDESVFDSFDFTALGHIHKRQTLAGGKVYYPGTPLKYSLSEAKEERVASVVTIEKGKTKIETFPLKPLRDLTELEGDFLTLLAGGSEDYVYLTLTDEEEIPDAVRQLRKKYPNLMQVRFKKREREREFLPSERREESPLSLFEALYEKQNGEQMTEKMRETIITMIEEVFGSND